jgi:hypothetical protein
MPAASAMATWQPPTASTTTLNQPANPADGQRIAADPPGGPPPAPPAPHEKPRLTRPRTPPLSVVPLPSTRTIQIQATTAPSVRADSPGDCTRVRRRRDARRSRPSSTLTPRRCVFRAASIRRDLLPQAVHAELARGTNQPRPCPGGADRTLAAGCAAGVVGPDADRARYPGPAIPLRPRHRHGRGDPLCNAHPLEGRRPRDATTADG